MGMTPNQQYSSVPLIFISKQLPWTSLFPLKVSAFLDPLGCVISHSVHLSDYSPLLIPQQIRFSRQSLWLLFRLTKPPTRDQDQTITSCHARLMTGPAALSFLIGIRQSSLLGSLDHRPVFVSPSKHTSTGASASSPFPTSSPSLPCFPTSLQAPATHFHLCLAEGLLRFTF